MGSGGGSAGNGGRYGPTSLSLATGGAGLYHAPRRFPAHHRQWLRLRFHTEGYFSHYANDHIAIAVWGALAPMPYPLVGRGVALGHTGGREHGCRGIVLEHFEGDSNRLIARTAREVALADDEPYCLEITATAHEVGYRLWGDGDELLADADAAVPDTNASADDHKDWWLGLTSEFTPGCSAPARLVVDEVVDGHEPLL